MSKLLGAENAPKPTDPGQYVSRWDVEHYGPDAAVWTLDEEGWEMGGTRWTISARIPDDLVIKEDVA